MTDGARILFLMAGIWAAVSTADCAADSAPAAPQTAVPTVVTAAAPAAPAWCAPGPFSVASVLYDWQDAARDKRVVPVKIYYPSGTAAKGPFPLIVMSHGLGGTREGYRYLGTWWAAHGYIVVHPQHAGSDDAVWRGKTQAMKEMQGAAASLSNAINRPRDISFVIDRMLALDKDAESPFKGKVDAGRIGVAGHSFGAYTALAAAGERFPVPGSPDQNLADPRVKAALPMSAPVSAKAKRNPAAAFGPIAVPCLHMTGTRDDSPIGNSKAADRRIPFDNMSKADNYLVTFKDGDHMIFSDQGRTPAARPLDPLFHGLIQQASTAFWDAYLKGDASARAWLGPAGGFAGNLAANGNWERKPAAPVPAPAAPGG